jgi:pSer/pThr/pTyr-binding forkhead associated (FHA) protein
MIMAAAQPPPVAPPANAPAATMMMPSLNVNAGLPGAPAPAAGGQPSATMFFGAAQVERFARLILVKGHTQFGTQWRLQAGETVIGRNQGMVIFPDDEYLADKHCRLEFRGDDLWLVPEKTTNGVYMQLKGKAPLSPGSEFIAGSSRFRILPDQERATVLTAGNDDSKPYGSMSQDLNILLQRVAVDPRMTETYARPQRLLSVGRSGCDLNFPTDGYLSTRHVQLMREDTGYMLEDLKSRNGTFIRCDHEVKLKHGDGLLIGEQVMRVEVIAGLPQPG